MISTVKHASWSPPLYEETRSIQHPLFTKISSPSLSSYCRPIIDISENTKMSSNSQYKSSNNDAKIKTILESRREFLDSITSHQLSPPKTEENQTNTAPGETGIVHNKKRKISFKVNTYSNKRTQNIQTSTVLSANKVAQLTQKFNKLIHEEPKIARAVRRANSTANTSCINNSNSTSSNEVLPSRKPLIKPKQNKFDEKRIGEIKKQLSVKRKLSVKRIIKQDDKSEKTHVDRSNEIIEKHVVDGRTTFDKNNESNLDNLLLNNENSSYSSIGNVRATIEKFERRKSISSDVINIQSTRQRLHSIDSANNINVHKKSSIDREIKQIVPKPRVPEKKFTAKTKNLVIKDGVRKLKIVNNINKFENSSINDEQHFKKSILKPSNTLLDRDIGTNEEVILETKQIQPMNIKCIDSPVAEKICHKTETINKLQDRKILETIKLLEVQLSHKKNENLLKEKINDSENIDNTVNNDNNEETILENKSLSQNTQNKYSKSSSKNMFYERIKIPKTTISTQLLKMAISEENISNENSEYIKPNNSFLWRSRSRDSSTFNAYATINYEDSEEVKTTVIKSIYEDTGQSQHDYNKNDLTSEISDPENLDDIYDTVEAPKQKLETKDEEKKTYEKLLSKTDEILKEYKSSKILKYLPSETDSSDTKSENIYESFYNSKYEELEAEYEYPENLNCIQAVNEDIYETLSIKTIPDNTKQVETKIITKPLPEIPNTIDNKSPITVPSIKIESSSSHLEDEDDEEIYAVVKEPNCYETIYPRSPDMIQTTNVALYNKFLTQCESYESIFASALRRDDLSSSGSNRESIISCDQQSNSLYGRYMWNSEHGRPVSEISSSDRSDDWEDLSDQEFEDKDPEIVIVREKQKTRRNPGWSHKVRDQFSKCPQAVVIEEDNALNDSFHYYESLHSDDDFDSFDSESDDDDFVKINQNDSGVDMGNCQLPDPPGNSGANSQIYGLTRLAASAGKHMKRLRRNWSLTKNDITKSLSRMTKKKSTNDLNNKSTIINEPRSIDISLKDNIPPPLPMTPPPVSTGPQLPPKRLKPVRPPPPLPHLKVNLPPNTTPTPPPVSDATNNKYVYQNMEFKSPSPVGQDSADSANNSSEVSENYKSFTNNKMNAVNSMGRKKNWLKFRRAVSMTEATMDEAIKGQTNAKSTFYLTNETDADSGMQINGTRHMSLIPFEQSQPVVPVRRRMVLATPRPQSPPPPAPNATDKKIITPKKDVTKDNNKEKLRSTSWYAECGLFKASNPADLSPINIKSNQVIIPPAPVPPNVPQRSPSTCWYAEVGLYQQGGSTPSTSSTENSGSLINSDQQEDKLRDIRRRKNYQQLQNNYNIAVNNQEEYYNMRNSSESNSFNKGESGCYYNEEFCDTEKMKRHQSGDMQLLLKDEPLYQFYDAAIAECEFQETSSDSEYDGYEEIGSHMTDQNSLNSSETSNESSSSLSSPYQLSSSPNLFTARTRVSGPGSIVLPGRTLWCEIPEVIQSKILCTLTASQKKLQEAKFEILTSEASYLNSLTVLEEHFVANLSKDSLLDPEDRKILFGNVKPVRKCSERLLADLESCWQSSVLLTNICGIIYKYCTSEFSVYVQYCANQVRSDATLRRCRGDVPMYSVSSGVATLANKNKAKFIETLKKLEASPACQALSLHSFMMLPMQRVTRLPLLVDAVLRRLTPDDDEFEECQKALRAINDVVSQCNDAAREAERLAEVQRIALQLEYPAHIPPVNLLKSETEVEINKKNNNSVVKRWLVRSGDLTQLVTRGGKADDGSMPVPKLTFGKRFTKLSITLFLFEDILIVARKKNDDQYVVLHHCPRSFVEVSSSSLDSSVSPTGAYSAISPGNISSDLLMFLTLLENHEGRTVELMLVCSTETDLQRWLEALRPPIAEDPTETVYESWDCPQVRAVHQYQACQPDELALSRGDVVNVAKKMADGWYYGTRLRDGISGWFPGNYTTEIANPHVRARNLRQRYRLLAFTDTYLNSNK